VPESAVADAGGLLVLAGLLQGQAPETAEVLALDSTSLLVAEYLALRHEGAPVRARGDFGLVVRAVSEWFPVRALAIEAVLSAGEEVEVESLASMALAESLRVPLITKNHELSSSQVTVLYC
jgi:hypothetical protein